jgi:uncharacterized protein HemY
MSLLLIALILGLTVGIALGYDAERWDQPVNAWSLLGFVLSVIALVAWLVVRHGEAGRRRASGTPLPPAFFSWWRGRRRAR